MARPCAVCIHESRTAIEQAILNRKPAMAIARDFKITYRRRKDDTDVGDHKVIQRHRDQCMADLYQKAVAEMESESAAGLAHRLKYLDEQVTTTIQHALTGEPVMVGDVPLLDDEGRTIMRRDYRLLLAAVREGRANAELLAKLAGRVEDGGHGADQARADLDDPLVRKALAEVERARMLADQSESGGRS